MIGSLGCSFIWLFCGFYCFVCVVRSDCALLIGFGFCLCGLFIGFDFNSVDMIIFY